MTPDLTANSLTNLDKGTLPDTAQLRSVVFRRNLVESLEVRRLRTKYVYYELRIGRPNSISYYRQTQPHVLACVIWRNVMALSCDCISIKS